MSGSFDGHLVSPGRASGSARQDPLGLPGQSEVGATLHSPRGAAPTPVSAAGSLPARQMAFPRASVLAAAALTIFEGQGVFRLTSAPPLGASTLFRLRRGSRFYTAEGLPS